MNPWQEQDVKSVFNNGFAMPIYFLIILNIKNQSALFLQRTKKFTFTDVIDIGPDAQGSKE